MKISVTSKLPASASSVWERLRRSDTLLFISKGFVEYQSNELPEYWQLRQRINIRTKPFFAKRATDYFVTFTKIHDKEMVAMTQEEGVGISRWDHTMKVTPIDAQTCRYTDTIIIEAGLMTVPTLIFAWFFYHYRHYRWKKLLHR